MTVSPAYSWSEFVRACQEDFMDLDVRGMPATKVYVYPKALETSRAELGLRNVKEVLDFVSRIKEEELWDLVVEPLREAASEEIIKMGVLVDSYSYKDSKRLVYVAFWKNPKTNKWVLKSLALNHQTKVGEKTFNDTFMKELSSLKIK